MPVVPINLNLTSNPARDRALGAARLINCYAENLGTEGKFQFPIYAADGYEALVSLPLGGKFADMMTLDADNLFVVSGTALYRYTGTLTLIGTVANDGFARIKRNRAEVPEIGVVTDAGQFFVVNTGTNALTNVTDSNAFLERDGRIVDLVSFDGYAVLLKSNGEVYISAIDNWDSFDEIGFATVSSSPHGLVAGATRGTDLVLFGPRATEFWQNTGATDYPLERLTNVDVGCYARGSVSEIVIPGEQGVSDSVIWAATNADGAYVGIFAMSGYGGSKISNHAVDRAIRDETTIANITSTTWSEGGHTFYAISTSAVTWVYDVVTGLWHERQSVGSTRWNVGGVTYYGGYNVAAHYDRGELYTMRPSVTSDKASQLSMRSSDDNGNSWSVQRFISIGESRKKRFKFTRLGATKEDGKLIELQVTNAVDEDGQAAPMIVIPPHVHAYPDRVRIHELFVDIVPGSSTTAVPKALGGVSINIDKLPEA